MRLIKLQTIALCTVVALLYLSCLTGADRYGNELDSDYTDEYVPPKKTIQSCISGSDCAADQCSVMGMQRFSEPRCEPRGQLGQPCRMDAEPENRTLSMPFGLMECKDVYLQFCPCAEGLVCREATCQTRRRPSRPIQRPNQFQRSRAAARNLQQWTIYNGLYGDRIRA